MGAFSKLTDNERIKYEIAIELGLLERLEQVGWAGLSAKESGRVGGKIGQKRRQAQE